LTFAAGSDFRARLVFAGRTFFAGALLAEAGLPLGFFCLLEGDVLLDFEAGLVDFVVLGLRAIGFG
jgi:hypothetical protein